MVYVCVDDYEEEASKVIEKKSLDFFRNGAGEFFTLNLNREAFKRWRLRPRILRNVSNLNLSCEILGCQLKWPLGIAPMGLQKLAHEIGEVGSAIAAGKTGALFVMSTVSTTSIEEVAEAAPDTCKWFQLYIYKDRSISMSLIKRAEKANFKAIILTVDAQVLGQRRSEIRNNFTLPSHLTMANFEYYKNNGYMKEMDARGLVGYVTSSFDTTINWDDLKWLIQYTNLPVIVKGILTPEDAILAREYGCAGIIVSNHGARQLDGVPAAIEVLPEIVKAVGKEMVIMMDGGVRQGNDVFKALALGAKMVFIGRPAIWGLACGGQIGVENMLTVLRKDFEIAMILAGCKTIGDILPDMVRHESYYSKL